jgi:hypothetical protein
VVERSVSVAPTLSPGIPRADSARTAIALPRSVLFQRGVESECIQSVASRVPLRTEAQCQSRQRSSGNRSVRDLLRIVASKASSLLTPPKSMLARVLLQSRRVAAAEKSKRLRQRLAGIASKQSVQSFRPVRQSALRRASGRNPEVLWITGTGCKVRALAPVSSRPEAEQKVASCGTRPSPLRPLRPSPSGVH